MKIGPCRPWSMDLLALPDPLRDQALPRVRVDACFFQHVIERHAEQPLEYIFGEQTFKWLCKRPSDSLYRDATERLAKELRVGLTVGLTLAFDVPQTRRQPTTTYVVVLPSGATAALRVGREVSLRTVFFPDRSLRRRSLEGRRGAAAGVLVNRYAMRCDELCAYVPPTPEFRREFTNIETGRMQVRTNVRFHDPARWGFRPDLLGSPYRGRPDVRFSS